jgi:uncharacterized membrane protein
VLGYILSRLKDVRPEILTLIVAMLPIAELRGAIPLALSLKLSAIRAYGLGVTGNLIPVLPVLFFLGPASNYLRKFSIFDRFFTWLFQRTQNRSKIIEKLQLIGLVCFVAIPLPMTGAWTGSVAAFLFQFRIRDSFWAISLGVFIAGLVVTMAWLGVIHLVPFAVMK